MKCYNKKILIHEWFDSDQLKQGDIMRHEILFGIQKSSIYVIFIIQAYVYIYE